MSNDAYTHPADRSPAITSSWSQKHAVATANKITRKAAFLDALHITGNVTATRKLTGIPKGTVATWRINPVFVVEMELAMAKEGAD